MVSVGRGMVARWKVREEIRDGGEEIKLTYSRFCFLAVRFLACLRLLSLFLVWVVVLLWSFTGSNHQQQGCKLRAVNRSAVQSPQANRKEEFQDPGGQLQGKDFESGV